MSDINIGDKVEFIGRGRKVVGTVTDVKLSRPGSRNALVRSYGLHTPTQRKLLVLPDGTVPGQGAGVWTVPEQMCKLVAKGGGDPNAGKAANKIILSIAQQRFTRASQGRESADDAGFYDLKKGDDIEVKFSDVGWQRRKFSHVTHSGQVGFYREGDVRPSKGLLGLDRLEPRVRFAHSSLVRKPQ